MSDSGAAPTAQPTPTTPTTPTASWTTGIQDAEVLGHAQTKGWDKLDPSAAFTEAVRAHRNAERMIGAPTDQLVRLPTRPDDEAGWKAVWQKLGAPSKPEDYSFDGIDFDGDPDLNSRFSTAIRETAAKFNMPKQMVEALAQQFHKFVDDGAQAQHAESTAALQEEQQKLTADWGKPEDSRFRANMFIADRAAMALGVDDQTLAKLKDGMGAYNVANMFLKIGVQMGEDKYVGGQNASQPGMMSVQQAMARRSELQADRQFVDRYLKGGAAEIREMTALNTLISGASI